MNLTQYSLGITLVALLAVLFFTAVQLPVSAEGQTAALWQVMFNTQEKTNPVPLITSIKPTTVPKGGKAFTLVVKGKRFITSSVVKLDGVAKTTAYISSNQLRATILSSDIAIEGPKTVTVFNPSPGGGSSDAKTLTVKIVPPTCSKDRQCVMGGGGKVCTNTFDCSCAPVLNSCIKQLTACVTKIQSACSINLTNPVLYPNNPIAQFCKFPTGSITGFPSQDPNFNNISTPPNPTACYSAISNCSVQYDKCQDSLPSSCSYEMAYDAFRQWCAGRTFETTPTPHSNWVTMNGPYGEFTFKAPNDQIPFLASWNPSTANPLPSIAGVQILAANNWSSADYGGMAYAITSFKLSDSPASPRDFLAGFVGTVRIAISGATITSSNINMSGQYPKLNFSFTDLKENWGSSLIGSYYGKGQVILKGPRAYILQAVNPLYNLNKSDYNYFVKSFIIQ